MLTFSADGHYRIPRIPCILPLLPLASRLAVAAVLVHDKRELDGAAASSSSAESCRPAAPV